MTTYAFGYSGQRRSLDWIRSSWQVAREHPEMIRRTFAMMEAAALAGTDLGIGGGARSWQQQDSLFRSRYYPCDGGLFYDGQRWCKKDGVAAAAPPGRSYHEDTALKDKTGKSIGAGAFDMIGDLRWMRSNCAKFGLKEFSQVNNEPWHTQLVGVPNSYSSYDYTKHLVGNWALPTPPPPPPVAVEYDQGVPVPPAQTQVQASLLASVLQFWGWQSVFGMQSALGVPTDGNYGPVTARKYQEFLRAMKAWWSAPVPKTCEWPNPDADGWHTGDKSDGVRQMQALFNKYGPAHWKPEKAMTEDGIYGRVTTFHVVVAQSYLAGKGLYPKLSVDGTYGPATRTALCKLVGTPE